MIGAGDLKWKVRFDKIIEASDPAGGKIQSWSTVGTGSFIRSACIKPQYGSEPVQQQRLNGLQPVLIFVHSDSSTRTIDPSWRAVELLNGVEVAYYAIKTAADMERKRQHITMQAVMGAADGGAG